jgi:hypothetical protein
MVAFSRLFLVFFFDQACTSRSLIYVVTCKST